MEENNVLKSRLLEGGLSYSIFEEGKKGEGELKLAEMSLMEMNKTLRIKRQYDSAGMHCLKGLLDKKEEKY